LWGPARRDAKRPPGNRRSFSYKLELMKIYANREVAEGKASCNNRKLYLKCALIISIKNDFIENANSWIKFY
jgi:hypothetical protein